MPAEISDSGKEDLVNGGQDTILIVDDDDLLVDLTEEAMRKFGYRTLRARNGEDALDIYMDLMDQIHLIILDLNIPGMGGHKCLNELRRINPQIKIIVASGYSAEGWEEATIRAGAAGFMAKPYDLKNLLNTVREVLDRA